MAFPLSHALTPHEPLLRLQLPARLYAQLWVDPSSAAPVAAMQHLDRLHYLLTQYLPYSLIDSLPEPGHSSWQWRTSALMFTDLAGFTRLTQAYARQGYSGAQFLAGLLNTYFSQTIEIINASGGDLLEFTGDALLVEFPDAVPTLAMGKAIRAGLRLQRMMARFAQVSFLQADHHLAMRVGIHHGRFLAANVGTPMRMVHLLLGHTVRLAKQAEGAGEVGRVCVTPAVVAGAPADFSFDAHTPGYALVRDDLEDAVLGDFDLTLRQRRHTSSLLSLSQTPEEVSQEIAYLIQKNAQLTSFLAPPVLKLMVEHTQQKAIPPLLSRAAVLFVNLLGLPEAADRSTAEESTDRLVQALASLFAQINGLVEAQRGFLQNWTYHAYSDILAYFGIPNASSDDALRAAATATEVLRLVQQFPPVPLGDGEVRVSCQIGLAWGTVVAGDIGHPKSRRDYNALGNPVNRAACIMGMAAPNQILMTASLERQIRREQERLNMALPFTYTAAGTRRLKADQQETAVFELSQVGFSPIA